MRSLPFARGLALRRALSRSAASIGLLVALGVLVTCEPTDLLLEAESRVRLYFHPSGSLDLAFGTGGKTVTDFSASSDVGNAVAIQEDGKILVAGTTAATTGDFALARYTAAGELDMGFGVGGKVTTDIGGSADGGYAVAVRSNGDILVAGDAGGAFVLVCYTSSGTLKASFGGGGKVTTALGSTGATARAIAIQADGKIVLAGITTSSGDSDFAVARYTSSGALDSSFGTGGKVITDIGSQGDLAYAVALQGDGKILVGGTWSNSANGNTDFVLVRYKTNGTLDSLFASNGVATADFGSGDDIGFAVATEPDGTIVVAGCTWVFGGGRQDFAVARFLKNGAPDATFGSAGKATAVVGQLSDYGFGMAIQEDASILVATDSFPSLVLSRDFALVRFTAGGALDQGFGDGGAVTTDFSSFGDYGPAIAIQADGMIVQAGVASNGTDDDFALVRYYP